MKKFIVIATILSIPHISGMYPIESQFFKTVSEKIEHILLSIENNNAILSQLVYQTEGIISIFDYEDMIRSQLAESIIDGILNQQYRSPKNSNINNNNINLSINLWPYLKTIFLNQESLELECDALKSSYNSLINDYSEQLLNVDHATKFLDILHTAETHINELTRKQQELILNYQYLLDTLSLNKKIAYNELKKIKQLIETV